MIQHQRQAWPAYNLIFAAILWGLLWIPLQRFAEQGFNGFWASSVMYGFAVTLGCVLMMGRWRELGMSPGKLLGISLASGWCNLTFIVAVAEGDAARVVLLFYLSPVWTILLGIVALKEKPSRAAWYVCLVAIVGAMAMLWNPSIGMPWPHNRFEWLAISSGMSFAIMNVLIRDLQTVSVRTKAFMSWVGVFIVACVWLGVQWRFSGSSHGGGVLSAHDFVPKVDAWVWWSCVVLGLAAIVPMTLSVQYGVTKFPVYKSSIILLTEVAVTVVSWQLLSDNQMTLKDWIGGSLIVSASVLFALRVER